MEEPKKHEEEKMTQSDNASENENMSSSENELEMLRTENEQLRVQSAEYLDSLQRERASFANYRRRVDQENLQIYDIALGDVVKIFLPVVDDLERAIKQKPEVPEVDPWYQGIELTLQKLHKTLESKGVQKLDVNPGDQFDPSIHEAVSHEDHPDFSDGQVVEVLQNGYKLKDRIIRPALVRVAK
jgi:molecular chaperone GrpE